MIGGAAAPGPEPGLRRRPGGCGAGGAVIGEALWRRRFGASPAVIGRTVAINRAAFTIVGVTAASGAASALGAGVDAWTPLAHADAVLNPGWRTDPAARWFAMFALPATSVAELDAGLARAAGQLARRQPEAWRDRTAAQRAGDDPRRRSTGPGVLGCLDPRRTGAADPGRGRRQRRQGCSSRGPRCRSGTPPSTWRSGPAGPRLPAGCCSRGRCSALARRPGVAAVRVGTPAGGRGRAAADAGAAPRPAARRAWRWRWWRPPRRRGLALAIGPARLGDARRHRGGVERRRAARARRRHRVARRGVCWWPRRPASR